MRQYRQIRGGDVPVCGIKQLNPNFPYNGEDKVFDMALSYRRINDQVILLLNSTSNEQVQHMYEYVHPENKLYSQGRIGSSDLNKQLQLSNNFAPIRKKSINVYTKPDKIDEVVCCKATEDILPAGTKITKEYKSIPDFTLNNVEIPITGDVIKSITCNKNSIRIVNYKYHDRVDNTEIPQYIKEHGKLLCQINYEHPISKAGILYKGDTDLQYITNRYIDNIKVCVIPKYKDDARLEPHKIRYKVKTLTTEIVDAWLVEQTAYIYEISTQYEKVNLFRYKSEPNKFRPIPIQIAPKATRYSDLIKNCTGVILDINNPDNVTDPNTELPPNTVIVPIGVNYPAYKNIPLQDITINENILLSNGKLLSKIVLSRFTISNADDKIEYPHVYVNRAGTETADFTGFDSKKYNIDNGNGEVNIDHIKSTLSAPAILRQEDGKDVYILKEPLKFRNLVLRNKGTETFIPSINITKLSIQNSRNNVSIDLDFIYPMKSIDINGNKICYVLYEGKWIPIINTMKFNSYEPVEYTCDMPWPRKKDMFGVPFN